MFVRRDCGGFRSSLADLRSLADTLWLGFRGNRWMTSHLVFGHDFSVLGEFVWRNVDKGVLLLVRT
jgi:hypothetical protein